MGFEPAEFCSDRFGTDIGEEVGGGRRRRERERERERKKEEEGKY